MFSGKTVKTQDTVATIKACDWIRVGFFCLLVLPHYRNKSDTSDREYDQYK